MRAVVVSHTHWDREWYRTFQAFRARLVDTVDRVLDLVAEDDGFHFQLDGQAIVLEDYVAIRPERAAALAEACAAGRVAVGPWYVQPDSFLPSGESHVRNLLEGRRVAERFGPCSTVAYTPDSFGHPAQLPQLFAGFGLGPFVYWRGNGNEIAALPAEYRWLAPDGSAVAACHLGRGYFNAWGFSDDVDATVKRLERTVHELAERAPRDCVLLMNGVDHMIPDENTRAVTEALAKHTGWEVVRGLLDDYVDGLTASLDLDAPDAPTHRGELCGGRVANLLPGVWSTRTYLKLANRRCESLLEGWAEPWGAIGSALGAPDERAALRSAWRELVANQAHDSICGCSQDRVHDQMIARYDAAEELADETTTRTLERIAGLGTTRQVPRPGRGAPVAIAVFNPSPRARTDVVTLPLSGFPSYTAKGIDPLLSKNKRAEGFSIDGEPARLVRDDGTVRPRLAPDEPVYSVQFVAEDVPAFGWKRVLLARAERADDAVDDGREIEAAGLSVRAADDGTLTVSFPDGSAYAGLCAVEDTGDRGDSYDYDPAPAPDGAADLRLEAVAVTRRRHPSGLAALVAERTFSVPARLSDDRATRSTERVAVGVRVEAAIAPGTDRVDLAVRVDNTARDHRLRLLFPCGASDGTCDAATTFDVARRARVRPDDRDWIHPAPSTFPSQGWISARGLTVVAPGLVESEVTGDGAIAVTLVRSVGWLSRPDLASRNGEAGPSLPTPGAQCPGRLDASLSLFASAPDERAARAQDFERGLRAVAAGDAPLAESGRAQLAVSPSRVVVSALKPADRGEGAVLRLSNPTDADARARVSVGFPFAAALPVRLDETPADFPVERRGGELELDVPAHALRTVWLTR